MKKTIIAVVVALSLVSILGGPAVAGSLGYVMERDVRGFPSKPAAQPSSPVVSADALIARPAGLAVTIAGTAIFLVTLPMSAISGSVDTAADGLIAKPGGWTFVRPMGRSDKRFDEKGIFQ